MRKDESSCNYVSTLAAISVSKQDRLLKAYKNTTVGTQVRERTQLMSSLEKINK